MTATVDERGRVLIPKSLRDHLGLTPGAPVEIVEEDGRLVLQRAVDAKEALRSLLGVLHEGNRVPDAPKIDPLKIKEIWEKDF